MANSFSYRAFNWMDKTDLLTVAKGLGRKEKSELTWSRWRCVDTNSAYIERLINNKACETNKTTLRPYRDYFNLAHAYLAHLPSPLGHKKQLKKKPEVTNPIKGIIVTSGFAQSV
jgi:hypothetical protein